MYSKKAKLDSAQVATHWRRPRLQVEVKLCAILPCWHVGCKLRRSSRSDLPCPSGYQTRAVDMLSKGQGMPMQAVLQKKHPGFCHATMLTRRVGGVAVAADWSWISCSVRAFRYFHLPSSCCIFCTGERSIRSQKRLLSLSRPRSAVHGIPAVLNNVWKAT